MSTADEADRRAGRRCRALRAPEGRGPLECATLVQRPGEDAGAAQRPRPGRASLADLGGAPARRQGRPREGRPPPDDALVRRAGSRRPARVQRRRAEADRRPLERIDRLTEAVRPRARMRIAVCAPQVPFARGGAEILADDARRRAAPARTRGRARHRALQVVPGREVLTHALPLAARRPRRGGRPADRPRDRDQVPGLLRPPPEQGRLGAAPVPAGLRVRPHRPRPVLRVAGGQGDSAARSTRSTRWRSARRASSSPRRGTSRAGSSARPASRPRCCRIRRRRFRTAATATRTSSSRSTVSTARSGSTCWSRRRRRDPAVNVVIAGDGPDRERLEGIARHHGLDGRVSFAGRVSDEELADLYARCRAVFYAPLDEDFGMVPYEAFLSEKPVRDDDRRGRPARGRLRSRDRARRRGATGGACRGARDRRGRGARVGSRRQGDRRAGHLGRLHRRASLVKVAYYSPAAAVAVGVADYSALLLPALRERLDVVVAEPGKKGPPPTSRSTTSATIRTSTAGSSTRCASGRASSSSTSYVLHHLIAGMTIGRGDGRGYLDAMERELGVAGRLLGLGVLENLLPLLWETRPEDFPLAARCSTSATGLIVHSRYMAAGAGSGLRGPALADPAPCLAAAASRGRGHRGRPADRLLRSSQHEQAGAAAARAFARFRRGIPARGCCSSARRRERFDSIAGSSGSARSEAIVRRGVRPRGANVVADGRPATCSSTCARRRWARRPAR